MTTKRALPSLPTEDTNSSDKDNQRDHGNEHRQRNSDQSCLTSKDDNTESHNTQHENARNDQKSSQPSSDVQTGSTNVITKYFPDDLPESFHSTGEYIIEKSEDTCFHQHSTILLRKRRKILYLLFEFGEMTMDGLVDSGAFINATSWSDFNMIRSK